MAQGPDRDENWRRRTRQHSRGQAAWLSPGQSPYQPSGLVVEWITTSADPAFQFQAPARISMFGHYIGWTISGTDLPWDLTAEAIEYTLGREW